MAKITVLGSGGWGMALAISAFNNRNQVALWSPFEWEVEMLREKRTNEKLLRGIFLPDEIEITTDMSVVEGSAITIIATPSTVIRDVANKLSKYKNFGIVVNVSKGIEKGSLKFLSEVITDEIPEAVVVALSGPSHAEEVINQQLTIVCSVCENNEYAVLVQQLFNNPSYFRVYTGSDLKGAELCGALKNIYAIASGMLYGLGLGDNARAGLISRALVEMKRFCHYENASDETVFGLTGLGDLVVTTTSHHSRNFQAGVKLATGSNLQETISSMTMVVEGARTAQAAYQRSLELDIEVPIIEEVYKVIYNHKSVKKAVNDLMSPLNKA